MGIIEFYTIYWWMRDELNLSGTELDCYAVIYCLSQSDNRYIAGIKRLQELLHKTEPSIINALKSLHTKGLVTKEPMLVNNVKHYYYKAIRPTLNNLSDTPKKILGTTLNNFSGINNINNNINNNKENRLSNDNQKEGYSEDFISFWKLYHNGSKQQAYKEWKKLKLKEKQDAIDFVNDYLMFCKWSGRKTKDTSSYLHQKGFNESWLATPEYYVVYNTDNERLAKFKHYMVEKHKELIYHRNPLTFEQANECIEKFTFSQTEWAMNKLKERDIHQYFSIAKGIEAIVWDNSDFKDLED